MASDYAITCGRMKKDHKNTDSRVELRYSSDFIGKDNNYLEYHFDSVG